MVVSDVLKQLYHSAALCLDDCSKFILMPEQFDQQAERFAYHISQAVNLLSSPPISVMDVNNEVHYCTSAEKWKLFMPFMNPGVGPEDEVILAVTNPQTNTLDKFKTTRTIIYYAMISYENLYNKNIDRILEINEIFMKTQSMPSRSDRLQEYRNLVNSLMENLNKDIGVEVPAESEIQS